MAIIFLFIAFRSNLVDELNENIDIFYIREICTYRKSDTLIKAAMALCEILTKHNMTAHVAELDFIYNQLSSLELSSEEAADGAIESVLVSGTMALEQIGVEISDETNIFDIIDLCDCLLSFEPQEFPENIKSMLESNNDSTEGMCQVISTLTNKPEGYWYPIVIDVNTNTVKRIIELCNEQERFGEDQKIIDTLVAKRLEKASDLTEGTLAQTLHEAADDLSEFTKESLYDMYLDRSSFHTLEESAKELMSLGLLCTESAEEWNEYVDYFFDDFFDDVSHRIEANKIRRNIGPSFESSFGVDDE